MEYDQLAQTDRSRNRRLSLIPILIALILLSLWLLAPQAQGLASLPPEAQQDMPSADHAAPSLQATPTPITVTKAAVGSFEVGKPASYLITVTRNTNQVISGPITVTDLLPVGYISPFVNLADPTWTYSMTAEDELQWVLADGNQVAAGNPYPTIRFQGVLSDTAAPYAVNQVDLDYTVTGEEPAFHQIEITTTVTSADLAVSKTVMPSEPIEGGVITYTMVVTNNGPSEATGVILTDLLPTGLNYKSSQPSGYTPGNGTWTLGNLAVNQTITLSLSATVNPDRRGTTITNTIQGLSSDIFDYDQSNNTSSAAFQVASTRLTGKVVYAKDNTTPIPTATVELSAGEFFFTTTTNTNGEYSFVETTNFTLPVGTVDVAAYRSDYYTTTAQTTLVTGKETVLNIALNTADLKVTKVDDPSIDTVGTNQNVTYKINVLNDGTYIAQGIVITDHLDTLLLYQNVSAGEAVITETNRSTDHMKVWEVQDLGPNEAIEITLSTKTAASMPVGTNNITNTVRANTTSREADLSNNTATDTNTNTTSGIATLEVSKSVRPASVRQNDDVTYTIIVSNEGNASATSVVLTDQIPYGLTLVSANTDTGSVTINKSTRTVTVNIGTLTAGQEAEVTIYGDVNLNVTSNTTRNNTATVRYNSGTTSKSASDSISITHLPSSSLPNTGGRELDAAARIVLPQQAPASTSRGSLKLLAGIIAALVGLASAAGIFYGLRQRQQQPEWAAWALKTGALLAVVALVFGLVAFGLGRGSSPAPVAAAPQANNPVTVPGATLEPQQYEIDRSPWVPATTVEVPPTPEVVETLPNFPIPTPTHVPSVPPGEPKPDTSAVDRIVIQDLDLDTVVKYVPYDEQQLTWKIAGLQQEVAWLGNTSWPGLGSNTGLAAHVSLNSGAEGPFRNLASLAIGSRITLYTEKNVYVYQVSGRKIVETDELDVVGPSDESQLTLITCTDWDKDLELYLKRLVVAADLIDVYPRFHWSMIDPFDRQ